MENKNNKTDIVAVLSRFEKFIKFCIVGVSNVLVSYVLNILCLKVLGVTGIFQSIDIYIANIFAFLLSVLWSCYWNNRSVFNREENTSFLKILMKTYLAYGFTGIILNNILSYVWVNVFGASKYIAPLVNSVISVPVNYILLKIWVFKDK